MRVLRILLCMSLLLLLIFAAAPRVSADEMEEIYQEQVEASGADELLEYLPKETRELLESIGITDFSYSGYDDHTDLQPTKLLQTILDIFGGQVTTVLSSCGLLLGVVVLSAIAEGFKHTLRDTKSAEMFSSICAMTACVILLLPIMKCLKMVAEAADGISVFMLSYIPTYAALILASGQVKLAATYSTLLLAAAEGVTMIVTNVVFPVLMTSLGISAVGVFSSKSRMSQLGATLAKFSGWLLGVVTGIFGALLSMQGVISVSADSIAQRTAKMSIGTFVPIVGGVLSEAFGAVSGCVKMLRSTLGMFGVAATVLLLLPSFCRCFSWSIAIGVCQMISDMFDVQVVSALLRAIHTVIKTAIAVLTACAMLMIVSTTLVAVVGGVV